MAMIASFELLDALTCRSQTAELWDTVEPRHRAHLENDWPQALEQLLAKMPADQREESAHWNWPEKLECFDGVFGREAFVIECGG